MLCAKTVAAWPGFTVSTVRCCPNESDFSASQIRGDHRLVLVRHGRFRRRADGEIVDLDRTVGYIGGPGEEEGFAHPAGGDICTAVTIEPELLEAAMNPRAVYVDARVELAHRRVLAAAAAGDVDCALTEELIRLVGLAAQWPVPRPGPTDRMLVSAAREAIIDGAPESTGLRPLAAALKVSPYRLSRVFSRCMGVSLTRYRNRIRVGQALERVADGDTSLAELAAHLGFADQAHLTRTVSEHLGYTPAALRRQLTGAPSQAGRNP